MKTDKPEDAAGADLRQLLRTAGLSHETDVAAILTRIEGGLSAETPAARQHATAEPVRQPEYGPGRRGPLLWASASLAVAATIVVAILLSGGNDGNLTSSDGGPDATMSTTVRADQRATTTQSVPSEPSSDTIIPATGATGTTETPGAVNTGPTATVATSIGSGTAPSLDVPAPPSSAGTAPVPSPASVEPLPGRLRLDASLADWLVTGARSDGVAIRLKQGASTIKVSAPTGSAPAPAPVDIVWQEGFPEQDRLTNGRWLTAPVSGPITVTVDGSPGLSRVTVYCGGTGAVTATVTLAGLPATTVQLPARPGSPDTAGAIVVELDGDGHGRDLTVSLQPVGQAQAAIGAVTAS